MVLSMLFLLLTVGSFLVNDISSHHQWMENNRAKISEHFQRDDRHRKGPMHDGDRMMPPSPERKAFSEDKTPSSADKNVPPQKNNGERNSN